MKQVLFLILISCIYKVNAQKDTVIFSELKLISKKYYYHDSLYSGIINEDSNHRKFQGKIIDGKKNGLWIYYSGNKSVSKTIDYGEDHCLIKEYDSKKNMASISVIETSDFFPEIFDEVLETSIEGFYFYYDKNGTISSFKYIQNNNIDWYIYDPEKGYRKK